MKRPFISLGLFGAIVVGGISLLADCIGALFWPEQSVLAVADLHLEKGSSFATRGVLLPPYDTAATLARLFVYPSERHRIPTRVFDPNLFTSLETLQMTGRSRRPET